MSKVTRWEGTVDAATGFLQQGLSTVEEVHKAIADKPFDVLRQVPAVGEAAELVRVVHGGITAAIYGSLHAAVGLLGVAAKVVRPITATDEAEPHAGSPMDLALAALNGVVGDRLESQGSPLAVRMEVRCAGRRVELDRLALQQAFPSASSRIALFVHGLAGNEATWSFYSREHYDNDDTTYGARLQADLGYTPVYVRYNSGLHISENGSQLADLIDQLSRVWPVAIDEITLIGHSMGGLVLRSACHYARTAALPWLGQVRHVVYLGSPHLGSPVERAGNVATWLLDQFDVTRAFARLAKQRSAGIKDLRYGALTHDSWQDGEADALLDNRSGEVPLVDSANHYFVAAILTRDPEHPLGVVLGDWLVPAASASGRSAKRDLHAQFTDGRRFGSMTHMRLLNHPAIYEQIVGWLQAEG